MRELKLLNPTQVGNLDQQSNEGVDNGRIYRNRTT